MTRRTLSPDLERDLNDLRRDLQRERPEMAERLEQVVERIRDDASSMEPADYVSTGEAAAALQVSPNTVKKWVRLGYITKVWALPGSGYLKIARSEIERIRAAGAPHREGQG